MQNQPEELLAHSEPLCRLARRLVRDEERADDLVQDTWLAALRRPPGDRGNLRGWLFAVARNLARRGGRDEERRRIRETRGAGSEAIVDDAAERASTQRELTDLLLRLDEPYRAVLLLRYFDEMTPLKISEALGIPVATVHTRIRRGRERLRDALTRNHRDREAWCASLAALAMASSGKSVSPWIGPALLRVTIPLLVLTAGATFTGWWWFVGFEEPASVELARPPGLEPVLTPRSDGEKEAASDGDEAPVVEREGPGVTSPVPEDLDWPVVGRADDPDLRRGARFRRGGKRDPEGVPLERGSGGATGAVLLAAAKPPGLLRIEGGTTRVGTTLADARALLRELPSARSAIAGETPQHSVEVEDFYLMPTEVTNEQFAVFVRATGAKPPWTWGGDAVDAGRAAFLEEQGRKAKEARDRGLPFDRSRFDAERWWNEHWRESKWEVPKEDLDRPAVYGDCRDAEDYARWAGLRLLSEAEYARAARADTARIYPWGDEWDESKCKSVHLGPGTTVPVGTHPASSVRGIHDLVGNAWEWTSSPYDKFPGYQPFSVEIGGRDGRTVQAMAPFDSDMRVLVSGSFQQDRIGVRCATRMFAERLQSTDAIGFRCAASIRPGYDAAVALIEEESGRDFMKDARFCPEAVTVLHRWLYHDDSVVAARVPGYAIIEDYQRMLFIPQESVPANSVKQLRGEGEESEPFFGLGLLAIDRPLWDPPLEPGLYGIVYLPPREPENLDAVPSGGVDLREFFAELPGFDPAGDQIIFSALERGVVAALPAGEFRYERMSRTETGVTVRSWLEDPRIERNEATPPLDSLDFLIKVPGASRSKGFVFTLSLLVEAGSFDGSWK